jgi:hypothetical protein
VVIAVGSIVAVSNGVRARGERISPVSVRAPGSTGRRGMRWGETATAGAAAMDGTRCSRGNPFAALQRGGAGGGGRGDEAPGAPPNRPAITALRTVRDTRPTYSAIAVDVNSDEVILQDNNLCRYASSTGSITHRPAPPKRSRSGSSRALKRRCSSTTVFTSTRRKSATSIRLNPHVGDKMTVFSREADGHKHKPKRILHTPHRGL